MYADVKLATAGGGCSERVELSGAGEHLNVTVSPVAATTVVGKPCDFSQSVTNFHIYFSFCSVE